MTCTDGLGKEMTPFLLEYLAAQEWLSGKAGFESDS